MFKIIKANKEVHQELKILAATEGRTMSAMIRKLINFYKVKGGQ